MPMTREHCERVASQEAENLLAELPPELASIRDEVLFIHEWRPAEPENADLLGLFEGADRQAVAAGVDGNPPMIRLFLENLRDASAHNPSEFRSQVRVTLLHELGHYLGLDEEDLAERGLE